MDEGIYTEIHLSDMCPFQGVCPHIIYYRQGYLKFKLDVKLAVVFTDYKLLTQHNGVLSILKVPINLHIFPMFCTFFFIFCICDNLVQSGNILGRSVMCVPLGRGNHCSFKMVISPKLCSSNTDQNAKSFMIILHHKKFCAYFSWTNKKSHFSFFL